jgi:hypothetical protein
MSVKNGLAMSIATNPIDELRPARSCRVDSLRTEPSLSIAAWHLGRGVGRDQVGEFRTLEAVPADTPASAATSFMLTIDRSAMLAPPLVLAQLLTVGCCHLFDRGD